jgi:hypothetical protein
VFFGFLFLCIVVSIIDQGGECSLTRFGANTCPLGTRRTSNRRIDRRTRNSVYFFLGPLVRRRCSHSPSSGLNLFPKAAFPSASSGILPLLIGNGSVGHHRGPIRENELKVQTPAIKLLSQPGASMDSHTRSRSGIPSTSNDGYPRSTLKTSRSTRSIRKPRRW